MKEGDADMRVELTTDAGALELFKMGLGFGAYGKESDRYNENSPNRISVDEKDIKENWMRKSEFYVRNIESVKWLEPAPPVEKVDAKYFDVTGRILNRGNLKNGTVTTKIKADNAVEAEKTYKELHVTLEILKVEEA